MPTLAQQLTMQELIDELIRRGLRFAFVCKNKYYTYWRTEKNKFASD